MYNGWKNYETWLVNLWLTNEPGTDKDLRDIVGRNHNDRKAADALLCYVRQLCPAMESASLQSDLINATLIEVDWREIVSNHREDEDEPGDADDTD